MNEIGGEEGPSYGTLFGRLLKDGEKFAKARLKLYRALAYYRFEEARGAMLMLLFAVFFGGAAIGALLIGLIIWLAAMIGGLLAGIVVCLVGLAIGGVLGYIALQKMPDMTELPWEEDDVIQDLEHSIAISPEPVEEIKP